MVRLKIRPYKMGSVSAKLLAQALNVKRLKKGSRYRPAPSVTVLNWGGSQDMAHPRMLNAPRAVRSACNKLSALRALRDAGVTVPDFTTSKAEAAEWQEDGYRVVARTLLNSHSGKGIVICQPDDAIVNAPLYTKYTKKEKEYRVHVFKGKIIDMCEKRKRNGSSEGNNLIRTLSNGWVYCRTNVHVTDVGKQLAINAVQALGLDFGAVDMIESKGKYYVLEVNSAPGLSGTTLQAYVNALRTYV